MKHRPIRSRKAISTVIANILVVSMVVSLGVMLYISANSVFMSYQGAASIWFSSRQKAILESFTIENVWFYETPSKHVNITVRNVGSVEVKIAAIYLNGSSAWSQGLDLEVGAAKTVSIAYTWTTGRYSIEVVSARGNRVIEYWFASG